MILDPWQELALHHALGETEDGFWSSFEVGLTVPRQNGKSAVIEVMMIAGLLLFDEELIVYSAHEFRTVKEIMRRVEGLLKASGEPYKPRRAHGEEGFVLGSDPYDPDAPRMLFQSRTGSAGRGMSGDRVILDEAMIINPEDIAALMPTLASRPNPQIVYAGSSVDRETHPHGNVFAGVRKRAIDGISPRLCYLEWGCEDGADPTDRRERARSNPSMGLRISEQYIEDEYQATLHTPKIFMVERMGVGDWPTLSDKQKPPVNKEVWTKLQSSAPILVSPTPAVIAVDRAPLSKVWVIIGAQYTSDGDVHVEIGYCQKASATDVVEALLSVITDADPRALVIDQKSPAAILKPYLIQAGIEPIITNGVQFMTAWAGLIEAIDSGQITHSGQPTLDGSILGTVNKVLSDGRLLPEALTGTWLGPTVAMMLAHWGLLNTDATPRPAPPPMMGKQEKSRGRAESEFDAMSAAF